SMTVEVNVLKALQKVQGSRLGPYLLDVDDWKAPSGNTYAFYVMEYLQGESMASFIQRNGKEWIGVLMLQLLKDLEQLHESGWVFGDLKAENLLVQIPLQEYVGLMLEGQRKSDERSRNIPNFMIGDTGGWDPDGQNRAMICLHS